MLLAEGGFQSFIRYPVGTGFCHLTGTQRLIVHFLPHADRHLLGLALEPVSKLSIVVDVGTYGLVKVFWE